MISKKVIKIPYYHVFFLKIVTKWLKKIMWVRWFLYYFLNSFVEKCSLMYRNLRFIFFKKRKQNHPTLMDFLKEIIKNVKKKIMWPVCFAHSIFKVYKKISYQSSVNLLWIVSKNYYKITLVWCVFWWKISKYY